MKDIKVNVKSAENKFTKDDEMRYNKKAGKLEQERYLPTEDLPFKKMLASPDKIHIGENILKDLASYDPLGELKIEQLQIETPYNFKDTNQLEAYKAKYERGILYTEVDYACYDPSGLRFTIEMQIQGESHLEKRIAYNIAEKYTSLYAGVEPGFVKYGSLKPVIAVVILKKSYFKNDDVPIRFLRPHDARFDLYKNNLNMGLEIYLELDKDASKLPHDLQRLFEFLRTGKASNDAPEYVKEAAYLMEMTNFTPEERKLADFYRRAQMKRISEDDYVKEQSREKGLAEGRQQGLAEGRQQGLEQGLEQGRTEEKMRMAKEMLQDGMSIEKVVSYSKLSLKDVQGLL